MPKKCNNCSCLIGPGPNHCCKCEPKNVRVRFYVHIHGKQLESYVGEIDKKQIEENFKKRIEDLAVNLTSLEDLTISVNSQICEEDENA